MMASELHGRLQQPQEDTRSRVGGASTHKTPGMETHFRGKHPPPHGVPSSRSETRHAPNSFHVSFDCGARRNPSPNQLN